MYCGSCRISSMPTGQPTGKQIVNDDDLLNRGLPRHSVALPESGTGSQAPQSPGASLFVVYQSSGEPLTKVVLYDGIHVQARGEVTSQTVRGFFQSSATHTARMTHIVGSGGPNPTNRLWFSNGRQAPVSVTSAFATASARRVGSRMVESDTGRDVDDAGRRPPHRVWRGTVSTSVDHVKEAPYDCLSWAAIVFSTAVQDTDADGLID